ncbi:MAG: thiamine phosphate synthase [Muribaculaceae bacterium]|nr:thiamine phosphate synthase [Muribaculaceae bacterium]
MADRKFIRIAITTPYFYSGEAARIEEKLRSSEADYIHIRKPDTTREEIASLIEAISPDLRQRLTLHDHTDMASKWGAGGIHLNRRCPAVPAGWSGRISVSLHSIEEFRNASGYDYATLSPIFPSISKPGYKGAFNDTELSEFLSSPHKIPVIALGGIDRSRICRVADMGFDGYAMLGDAWRRHIDTDAFSLQLITNPDTAECAARQAGAALEGGCRWIQLRWKDAPEPQIIEAAKLIAPLCREYNAIFLIDDHVELVEKTGADGVHLGKNDMPVAEARRILGPGKIIGATANTPDDILHAAQAGADYVGYGPFRYTTTKKNLSPVLGLEGYRKAEAFCHETGIRLPIVAIGGITDTDIPDIMQTGIQGIAMSGSINNAPDPVAAARNITETIRKSIIQ